MRPAAAVDAVGDARRLEPFLPGAAVGHEVHGVVVQKHVAREVFRLLKRRIAARELRARHRDGCDVEQVVGPIAGVVASAQMDLDAGHVLPQIQICDESSGVERAGVDHLARAEYAQFDARFALREIGQARHQPARGEYGRRSDQQLGLFGAFADHLDRRGERLEAFAQFRQARARRFREVYAASRAAEQFHAEILLEALDLVAHRSLGDGQLVRRVLE